MRPAAEASLDLLLQGQADGSIQVFLAGAAGQQAFAAAVPPQLQQAYSGWRQRFLAFHAHQGLSADALQHYGAQLQAQLQQWISAPDWHPLQQALATAPGAPLRLRFVEVPSWLERLPWEQLELQRPIWRLADPAPNNGASPAPSSGSGPPVRHRRPRLLLLVGDESGLALDGEIQRLADLQQRRRIQLTLLRGGACSANAIRQALADPSGWDGLVFLGHSEADAASGGRLHLGDGSWLSAQSLQGDLQQAAGTGLALVLLSSCSGLDLARAAVAAGIHWAICFREPVPCQAAAQAFCALLDGLESGQPLLPALGAVRQQLAESGPAGTHLLLSLVAAPGAPPLRLPLRKRRQFIQRLAASSCRQAIAAAALLALGVAGDLVPWNPLQQGLLNQRLRLQREWRAFTGQRGPTTSALPVLLLEQRRAYPALGILQPPDQKRLSRLALLRVLQATPPLAVPRLGIDAVLDQPAIEPAVTAELAALIRRQQRPAVFAGYYGAGTDGPMAGALSRPLPVLQQAGLAAYDLAVGTPAGQGGAAGQRPAPLQLQAAIDGRNFAHALSRHPQRFLPADAVIDWSLPWSQLIRRIQPAELPALKAPVLLVGSDGQLDPQHPDLFAPPVAISSDLEQWGLPTSSIPGVMVQAVLAQSLNLGHWLKPASLAATTALAAGLGVLLAAAQSRRRRLLLLLTLASVLAIALTFQLAISTAILVPVLLPLTALWATALLRRS